MEETQVLENSSPSSEADAPSASASPLVEAVPVDYTEALADANSLLWDIHFCSLTSVVLLLCIFGAVIGAAFVNALNRAA